MATRSFTGGAPAHLQDSLPALPAHLQSDTHLTAHLASRQVFGSSVEDCLLTVLYSFHVSLPTARLSSQGLICLNTYTSSSKGPNGGKDGSAMGEAEGLARRAWARLGTRQENQGFVFLLVSPAGMTSVQQVLTVLQWRVWLGQDDSPLASPFFVPLLFVDASLIETLACRLCF